MNALNEVLNSLQPVLGIVAIVLGALGFGWAKKALKAVLAAKSLVEDIKTANTLADKLAPMPEFIELKNVLLLMGNDLKAIQNALIMPEAPSVFGLGRGTLLSTQVTKLVNLGATLTLTNEETVSPIIHVVAGANAGAVSLVIPAVEDYQRYYFVWNASGAEVTVKYGDDDTGVAVANGKVYLFVASTSGSLILN